jgi:8-oxo-dGTP diphosphatase
MISVTAAIIQKNGLILAARREPGIHLAGYWEFPGGKIEQGETPEQCLQRELMEEFSIQCEIGEFVCESIFDYGHKTIQLLGYFATHTGGTFQLTDHDKICWLPVKELLTLQWAPADIPLVNRLQDNAVIPKM